MKYLCAAALFIMFVSYNSYPNDYLGVVGRLEPVENRVIISGSRLEKKIAITIDDGWVDDEPLLELLKFYGIRCTVFIPGKVAESRPDFVRKLDEMGFEVCNHSYSHLVLTPLSDEEIIEDIRLGQERITEITGKTYPYFRPSGGIFDERVAELAAAEGYYIILWDNDVLGYSEDQTVDDQLQYLREHKDNGNIILSHFGEKLNTFKVLEVFIPELLSEGYEIVTITELLRSENENGRLAAGQ